MTDLQALKQRVESAEGPDRELDSRIDIWARPEEWSDETRERGYLIDPVSWYDTIPEYTSSVDAALSLVERLLPGWSWRIGNRPLGGAWVLLGTSRQEHLGATPALALITALLAALLSKGSEQSTGQGKGEGRE